MIVTGSKIIISKNKQSIHIFRMLIFILSLDIKYVLVYLVIFLGLTNVCVQFFCGQNTKSYLKKDLSSILISLSLQTQKKHNQENFSHEICQA